MEQLEPWVNTYLSLASTLIVAVATVVLVWLTSRYVRLTGRLVEETRKSREPAVTVDFETPDHSLRMVVQNHGLSPARNVRITVLKDVPWLLLGGGREGLSQSAPIRNGVSYLTPSRTLKYLLGYPRWRDMPDELTEASLQISYQDESGRQYEHVVDFDFCQLREVLFESFKDSNLAVAEAIKESERTRQSHDRAHQFLGRLVQPKVKKCGMCAEEIPMEARKCSHCQEMQEAADTVEE